MPSVAIAAAASVAERPRVPSRYVPFTCAVLVLALAALTAVIAFAGSRPWASSGEFWMLAGLCLVGEALPIRLARRTHFDEVTVSTAFAFAVLLAFGAAPAMVMYALVSVIVDVAVRRPLVKVVFNAAQYAVSIAAAGAVLALTVGESRAMSVAGEVPAVILSGVALFAMNHVLAGIGSAILTSRPLRPYLLGDFWFHAWAAGFQLALAPVLVVCAEFDAALIPLTFLPVAAIFVGGRQAVMNQHRALHDELTELPNRQLFGRRVDDAIATADETGEPFVLMLADLDDFKAVNDSLGHDVGDMLLGRVAERLRAAAPGDAVLARLGGDEFALLLPATDAGGGVAAAERTLDELEAPIEVASFSLDVRASFGIATYPAHGVSGQALLKNADLALYRAKETRTRCEVFGDRDVASFDRLSLAADLRRGIEGGELVLHYQPKLALSGDRLDGVEALVRWQHPYLGLIGPEGFIPLAEQSNLVKPLTRWVLDEALRQCRAWRDRGIELQVAVNLSTRSLLDRGLAGHVVELLEKWALPPSALELEITETKIIADFGRARQVLHELRAIGVRIAIDDFGTGYSSLVQLQQLPADEIKIDRSFVMDMETNAGNEAIVRSTIGLARSLALVVTAEGVETSGAYEKLRALGCDYAQGYYLGRPVPADACEREIFRHAAERRFARTEPSSPPARGPRRLAVTTAVALALGLGAAAPSVETAQAAGNYVVVYKAGVDPATTTATLERGQGFRASNKYDAAIDGFSANLSDQQRARLEADPSVDYLTPDVTFQADGTAPVAAREAVPPGIRRVRAATATSTHAAANDAVAVLDSGLDLASTDLNASSGVNCVTPGVSAADDNGHGTHVGGTIAGKNTGAGVVGVAPGTRLYAVKVLNSRGSGSLSSLLCGIDWVARNAEALRIRVANVSLSAVGADDGDCGRTNNEPLHTAICSASAAPQGVTFVASAGNSNVALSTMVPAAYREVLTVTAMTDTDGAPGGKGVACLKTNLDDKPWPSSNFATAADAGHVVAAPGACVVSTKLRGGTVSMTGTSMAAPHVAGTVALCLGNGGAAGPCAGLTSAQILQRIRSDAEAAAATGGWGFSGDPLQPLGAKVYGHLASAAAY